MKEVVQYIILSIVVLLISTYLIGAAVWFSTRPKQMVCSGIEWKIQDSLERQYITVDELTTLINRTNLNPEGKEANAVLTQAIETCVQGHPMVKRAQCFVTNRGQVRVKLIQRVPVLGVRTDGCSYYIDEDHLRMPTSARITTPVIWAVGKIDETLAKTVLTDMVEWLKGDAYWEDRIERMEVKSNQYIVLVDTSGLRIIVGDGQQFESRMNKLRVFEEQMKRVGGKTYKELDLRYKDQVIGRE